MKRDRETHTRQEYRGLKTERGIERHREAW